MRDVLMYRAYIGQKKYGVVLDEIRSSAPDALQAVKMFADYLSSETRRFVVHFLSLVTVEDLTHFPCDPMFLK